MSTTYIQGKNSQYGRAKRKRSSGITAGQLSRKLFFKGKVAEPQISPMVFDKAFARAMRVRNMAAPEQKYFEVGFVGTSISTTSVLTLLSGVLQGDTPSSRSGNKIRVTKIEFAATLYMSATAGGGQDTGKISIFIDKQTNGVAPGFSTGPSIGNSVYNNNGTNSYPLLKSSVSDDQFYIIKDWDYTLDANAGVVGAWQGDVAHLKAEIPIQRVIQYNAGNAGTVADCITNAFYFGSIGGQAAGAAATTMNGYWRMWFTDA